MLDRLGIRSRVLLLALLPAGLMALVLGSYFTWLQQSDLRTQLLQRGKMIAEQLAPLAAPAMAKLAPAQLERIAAQTLEQAQREREANQLRRERAHAEGRERVGRIGQHIGADRSERAGAVHPAALELISMIKHRFTSGDERFGALSRGTLPIQMRLRWPLCNAQLWGRLVRAPVGLPLFAREIRAARG